MRYTQEGLDPAPLTVCTMYLCLVCFVLGGFSSYTQVPQAWAGPPPEVQRDRNRRGVDPAI